MAGISVSRKKRDYSSRQSRRFLPINADNNGPGQKEQDASIRAGSDDDPIIRSLVNGHAA